MSLQTGKKNNANRMNYTDNEDIKSETRRSYAKFSKVKEQQTLTNKYNEKNQKQLMQEEELLNSIKQKEDKIEEYRKLIREGKYSNDLKTPAVVTRELKTKENQLQKKVVKYSTVNSENNAIMEKINALRKEKDVFQDIEKKLKEQLDKQKKQLEKKVDRFMEFRSQNRSLQGDIEDIKCKRENEQQNFNRGFQTMHNALRKENLKSTFQVRQTSTLLRRNRGVVGGAGNEFSDSTYVGFNKTQLNSTLEQLKKTKKTIDTEEEDNKAKKLEEYKKIIAKLKELMGEESFEGIQRKYEEMDDENYKLYNEVRGLIDDVDNLKEQKESLVEDIKLHEKSKEKVWSQRDDAAKYFEKTQADVKSKIEFYQHKMNGLKEVQDSILIGIPIIFDRIGCNKDVKEEVQNKLNDENIVNYLEQIEKKTNDILKLYEKYQQRDIIENMTTEKEADPKAQNFQRIAETEEINNQLDTIIADANTRKQMDDKLLSSEGLRDWKTYMKTLVDKKISKYNNKKPAPKK